jgi:uncharacterized protein (TIGR03435 family)
MQLDAGRLDWGLGSLADMIQYAFRVKNYQVSAPDWVRSSRWNILARLPEGGTPSQVPEMMQAMLADRFGLKVHHEKREQPVYALEVAKGGPRLESSEPSDGDTPAGSSGFGPGLFPGPFGPGRGPGGPAGNAPDGPGGTGRGGNGTGGRGGFPGFTTTAGNGATARMTPGDNCAMHLELSRLTMQDFADTLTPFLDKPVIDATELKGAYKATLELPMEVMFSMLQNTMRANGLPGPGQGGPGGGGPGGRGPGDGGGRGGGLQGCDPGAAFANGGSDTSSNAPIFRAVQKLGLKLEARKAPFDTVIVDHIEKTPTDN